MIEKRVYRYNLTDIGKAAQPSAMCVPAVLELTPSAVSSILQLHQEDLIPFQHRYLCADDYASEKQVRDYLERRADDLVRTTSALLFLLHARSPEPMVGLLRSVVPALHFLSAFLSELDQLSESGFLIEYLREQVSYVRISRWSKHEPEESLEFVRANNLGGKKVTVLDDFGCHGKTAQKAFNFLHQGGVSQHSDMYLPLFEKIEPHWVLSPSLKNEHPELEPYRQMSQQRWEIDQDFLRRFARTVAQHTRRISR